MSMLGRFLLCACFTFFLFVQPTYAATTPAPAIYGKLIFHRYSNYDAWDSQLYLYNFSTLKLTQIGTNWTIDHKMNGHFSPDGKWLTFMGVPQGQHFGDAWDIYLWRVNSTEQPVNLTQGNNRRDEDPKFTADGQSIVFKQNADLKMIRLADRSISSITTNGWATEESMPYALANTSHILYAKGARAESRIFSVDRSGAYDTQLTNIASYYPVSWQNGKFLYVRWYSNSNANDQIYAYDTLTKQTSRLPFNDAAANTSDPAPIDHRYLVVSRSAGTSYDLYLADSQSNSLWPLPFNTALQELGASYTLY